MPQPTESSIANRRVAFDNAIADVSKLLTALRDAQALADAGEYDAATNVLPLVRDSGLHSSDDLAVDLASTVRESVGSAVVRLRTESLLAE